MRRSPRNALDHDLLRRLALCLGLGGAVATGWPNGPLAAQPRPAPDQPSGEAATIDQDPPPPAAGTIRPQILFSTDGLETAPQASTIRFGAPPPPADAGASASAFAPATIGPTPPLGAASDLFGNLPPAEGSATGGGISFGVAPPPPSKDGNALASAAGPTAAPPAKDIGPLPGVAPVSAPVPEILRLAALAPVALGPTRPPAPLAPRPAAAARFAPTPVPTALRLRGRDLDPEKRPGCQILHSADPAAFPACPPEGEELAGLLQSELRRLGCYSGEIDGDWGARSRSALARLRKEEGGAAPPSSEPSPALLDWLRAAPEGRCEPVLAVLPAPPAPAITAPQRPSAPKPQAPKPAATRDPKPAPAPRPSAQTSPAPQAPASSDSNRARTRRIIN